MRNNFILWLKGESYNSDTLNNFERELLLKKWITYRKNFESIEDNITTDYGWGCMIRSLQMILLNGLIELFAENKLETLKTMFKDNKNSLFSIHNICLLKKSIYDKQIQDWIGPHTA